MKPPKKPTLPGRPKAGTNGPAKPRQQSRPLQARPKGHAAQPRAVALNWAAAMQAGRKMVRGKLLDRIAPPLTPPSEGGAADAFGVVLFPEISKVPGFRDVIVLKTYGGQKAYEIIDADKFEDGGKRGDVVGAYNHMRFALWTEWRTAYEMYGY